MPSFTSSSTMFGLSSQPSSSSSSTNSPASHHSLWSSNQNVMHVKLHVNKFHDNLLSKRLQQLNSDEMKQRLRLQRESNELIMFLRECKKTTGYLSQMKSFTNAPETETNKSNKYFDSQAIVQARYNKPPQRTSTAISGHQQYRITNKKPGSFTSSSFISSSQSSYSSSLSETRNKKKLPSTTQHNNNLLDQVKDFSTSSSTFSSQSSESFALSVDANKKEDDTRNYFAPCTRLTISNLDWYNKKNKTKSANSTSSSARIGNNLKSTSLIFTNSSRPESDTRKSRTSSNSSLDSRVRKSESPATTTMSSTQTNKQTPIKVRLTKNYIKRKQDEIVSEYSRLNTQEVMKEYRQVQHDLEAKVKQFNTRSMDDFGQF